MAADSRVRRSNRRDQFAENLFRLFFLVAGVVIGFLMTTHFDKPGYVASFNREALYLLYCDRLSPCPEMRRTYGTGPHATYVVMIVMANRDYDLIIGSKDAPYINKRLVPQAALMTNSHAIAHPSQPNYLALFSGSSQDVADDSCPHSFDAGNVGSELLDLGLGFAGYSESLPYDGYTGCETNLYGRVHSPWVSFTNLPPALTNLVYRGFPDQPDTLTIIVPNVCNDMRNCSTRVGDHWLAKNLPPILRYNAKHNGLLILTWDQADPDEDGTNHVATLLIGPMIAPGRYRRPVTHYSTLATIEDITGVGCLGYACVAEELRGMWR